MTWISDVLMVMLMLTSITVCVLFRHNSESSAIVRQISVQQLYFLFRHDLESSASESSAIVQQIYSVQLMFSN